MKINAITPLGNCLLSTQVYVSLPRSASAWVGMCLTWAGPWVKVIIVLRVVTSWACVIQVQVISLRGSLGCFCYLQNNKITRCRGLMSVLSHISILGFHSTPTSQQQSRPSAVFTKPTFTVSVFYTILHTVLCTIHHISQFLCFETETSVGDYLVNWQT